MKSKLMSLVTLGTLSLALTSGVLAGDPAAPVGAIKPTSPEFEKMKSLVGTWQGKVDMGQGPVDMTMRYRLLAGGTVLEERVFEGTPQEMVTMYYEKNGKLGLTHYCVMGNRPAMVFKKSDAKSITFDFDKSCGINVAKESHMHSLTIQFDDADTITTRCKALIDGKEMPDHPSTLKRVNRS